MSPSVLDIPAAAQAHAAIQRLESEARIERLDVRIATDVDHVETLELAEEQAHELGSDPVMLIRGKHLQERDEGTENAVARRCRKADDLIAVGRQCNSVTTS